MVQPFVISRKIQKSIFEGVEVLRFAPFTERDVKVLLIDLRECAKYVIKSLAFETNGFINPIKEFIEVCDFIAHASRDRGLVERMVRANALTFHKNLNLPIDEFAKIPIVGVLNANRLVLALACISKFALGDLKSKTHIKELHERQSEIALCILSMLQDCSIRLEDEEGFGVLQLMPHEGKYRVYCQLIQSKIEQEARARTGGTGKFVLGFPVMISDAECIDPVILSYDHEVFPPPIFETFRDENSLLQVRVVENDGDA
ncbi:MAG: hypothetical protein JW849_03495 [Phycisphaerae bacterium]|nr:hypothetical protein [Phycisphaerae bacterium]